MFVYADNAATTRVDQPVIDAMLPFFGTMYGNPSTLYSIGAEAKDALDSAREKISAAIGATPSELYFTSCGTESDNWAIKCVAEKYAKKGRHIISSAIEHHAVLHSLALLEKRGWEVTYLPVDSDGFISLEQLEAAIRDDTVLITIMFANNETGVIEPVAQIGEIAKKHGIIFHTDAVQAVGHVPVDVNEMHIDMLSISAHKFNAPKGIGALYIRKGISIPNFLDGGQQERGKRGGTENVPSIVAMSTALDRAVSSMDDNMKRIERLRNKLRDELLRRIPYSKLNTPMHDALPGTLNISFRYVEGEALLLWLDMNGICASSGSACTSGSLDPSHVLLALGLPHEVAHGSVRFSFDHNTTEEEVDYIIRVFPGIVQKLRDMSPLWERVENKLPVITD